MKKLLVLTFTLLSFTFYNIQAQMSILLVNDNEWSPDRIEDIKSAITNSGYTFGYWDAPSRQSGPSFEFMEPFNLVIWYTGDDGASLYFWNGNETENQDIKDYIDSGGMLWVQGLDFLYDKYSTTPTPFMPGEFVYDYLGINFYMGQSKIDDGDWSGVPQLDVVAGNGIFSVDPIEWVWEDQNMWYVDALEAIESEQHIYQMGPAEYDLSEYYSAIYYEKNDAKILTFAFETARMDTLNNTTIEVFTEGLQYFETFAEPGVAVEEINVTPEGGAVIIEENLGTLQLNTEVLPETATIPWIYWTIESDGVDASINQDGLLQASGNDNGNGTVTVKAEAMDGSGVMGEIQVEISGQGGEFNVLLVNDNANGTDRYKVIDTSLTNLEYVYNIYNTVVTGDYPDYYTLSAYDAVIWYTGNDGANLKLWDVSDTAGAVNQNLKFNEPLMQYINGGGVVALLGLDFIFDIYGTAWDDFNAGDFVYDFMGIDAYVVQSHGDGDDLPQLDVISGNSIFSFTPMKWVYADGLWFADGYEITDEAEAIYEMGPPSYQFHGYITGLYTQPGNGHLFTLAVETARIDTRDHTDEFFGELLEYFESIAPGAVNEIKRSDFTVFQNSPNPFKDFTTISYELNSPANVNLAIYDISGRKVFVENFGNQSYGKHTYQFSARDFGLSDGFYTYTLTVNNQIIGQKMIISK